MAKTQLQLQVDVLAAALAEVAGVLTADQVEQAATGLRGRLDRLAGVLDNEDEDAAVAVLGPALRALQARTATGSIPSGPIAPPAAV